MLGLFYPQQTKGLNNHPFIHFPKASLREICCKSYLINNIFFTLVNDWPDAASSSGTLSATMR